MGCGRTIQEISAWTRYSDTERSRLMAILPARLFDGPATQSDSRQNTRARQPA